MRLLKSVFIVFALSMPAFAEQKRAGLGFNYVYLQGDLQDYFHNGYGYSASGLWELPSLRENLFLGGNILYLPLKSDDIRESSALKLFNIGIGPDYKVFNVSWYELFLTVKPEYTYWNIKNKLSRDFDAHDSSSFWGFETGMTNAFLISDLFEIEAALLLHLPDFNINNVYYDVGIRLAKSF